MVSIGVSHCCSLLMRLLSRVSLEAWSCVLHDTTTRSVVSTSCAESSPCGYDRLSSGEVCCADDAQRRLPVYLKLPTCRQGLLSSGELVDVKVGVVSSSLLFLVDVLPPKWRMRDACTSSRARERRQHDSLSSGGPGGGACR